MYPTLNKLINNSSFSRLQFLKALKARLLNICLFIDFSYLNMSLLFIHFSYQFLSIFSVNKGINNLLPFQIFSELDFRAFPF